MRAGEIALEVWMLSVQFASRADVVSALRNGKGEDTCCWGSHLFDHLLLIIRSERKIDDRTDYPRGVARKAPLDQSVKTILRLHDLTDAGIML